MAACALASSSPLANPTPTTGPAVLSGRHFASKHLQWCLHSPFPRGGSVGASSSDASAPGPPPPRSADGSDTVFGFQCNERYLAWDDSAARQLIRLYLAQQLGVDVQFVNARLGELAAVLPELVLRFDKMQAGLMLRLVADTEAVAARMLGLRSVLEDVNISALVASQPSLLWEPDVGVLRRQLETLREALPGVRIERLLEEEPRLLLVDIAAVLAELERLLPGRTDPVRVLLADPSIVLTMKDAGLPASLTIDDGIEAE